MEVISRRMIGRQPGNAAIGLPLLGEIRGVDGAALGPGFVGIVGIGSRLERIGRHRRNQIAEI